MTNATEGGTDAPEKDNQIAKKPPLKPRVAAALDQYPGAQLVRLTMGYPARDENGEVLEYYRQVVVRPSTLNDEIRRDVELLRMAKNEAEIVKKKGGNLEPGDITDGLLEIQSSALSVAAMLVQVIVAFDDLPKVTLEHLRELTRTDVNMIQDGLKEAEDALVRAYEGNA